MKKFIIDNATLKKYKGKDTVVEIPNNVRTIAKRAFENCDKVETIKIPSSVEIIEPEAFCCNNLESIFIVDNPFINEELQKDFLINEKTAFVDKIGLSNFHIAILTNAPCPKDSDKLTNDNVQENDKIINICWETDFKRGLFYLDLPRKYKNKIILTNTFQKVDKERKPVNLFEERKVIFKSGFPLYSESVIFDEQGTIVDGSAGYFYRSGIDHVEINKYKYREGLRRVEYAIFSVYKKIGNTPALMFEIKNNKTILNVWDIFEKNQVPVIFKYNGTIV